MHAKLHQMIDELNETQAALVADYIALLLAGEEAEDAEDRADDGDNGTGRNGRRAAGHIELKTINGCGPYAYLRYWEGKHLRSKYLGKVKSV